MPILLSIFAALLGLAFGSFLNVCISRLPRHESVVAPRSRCPRCLTPILNRDNIPLLGWLLLRGRCRACGVHIPARYPLIEAASAALLLLCLLEFGLTLRGVAAVILCLLLLGLAASDAETLRLPDALTLPGIALGILYSGVAAAQGSSLFFEWRAAAESVLWAAVAIALIVLIRGLYWLLRRREGIGLGDAKLLAMIAAWLGWQQTLLAFFFAVIGAALYGIARMMFLQPQGNQGGLTARIPLGAFLSAAGLFAVFAGDSTLGWYLQFFH